MPEKSKLASLIDAVSSMVFEKPQYESPVNEKNEKKRSKKATRTGSFDLDW